MQHQVQPAVLDKIKAGELHHFPHLLPVARGIAMRRTLLAHRLRVVFALHQLGGAVSQ